MPIALYKCTMVGTFTLPRMEWGMQDKVSGEYACTDICTGALIYERLYIIYLYTPSIIDMIYILESLGLGVGLSLGLGAITAKQANTAAGEHRT